jgi:hypothetical protein
VADEERRFQLEAVRRQPDQTEREEHAVVRVIRVSPSPVDTQTHDRVPERVDEAPV